MHATTTKKMDMSGNLILESDDSIFLFLEKWARKLQIITHIKTLFK